MLENLGAFLVTHSILWRKGEENANYNLHFLVKLVLFLCRQEKNEKKPTQGALYVLLPQSNPPPCVSPGRIAGSGLHLNLNPVHAENVPIFCMKFGAVYTGRAARAAAAANSKTIRLKVSVVKV